MLLYNILGDDRIALFRVVVDFGRPQETMARLDDLQDSADLDRGLTGRCDVAAPAALLLVVPWPASSASAAAPG
jgi:hypothetical protein